MAVVRVGKPGSKTASPWLLTLLERRLCKVAAVDLAYKMARILEAELAKAPTDRLRSVEIAAEGMTTNATAYRRTPEAARPFVVAEEQKDTRRRWQTVEPTNRRPRLLQEHLDAASVFRACSAKPIWASGHTAASKAGHMTALVLLAQTKHLAHHAPSTHATRPRHYEAQGTCSPEGASSERTP